MIEKYCWTLKYLLSPLECEILKNNGTLLTMPELWLQLTIRSGKKNKHKITTFLLQFQLCLQYKHCSTHVITELDHL